MKGLNKFYKLFKRKNLQILCLKSAVMCVSGVIFVVDIIKYNLNIYFFAHGVFLF